MRCKKVIILHTFYEVGPTTQLMVLSLICQLRLLTNKFSAAISLTDFTGHQLSRRIHAQGHTNSFPCEAESLMMLSFTQWIYYIQVLTSTSEFYIYLSIQLPKQHTSLDLDHSQLTSRGSQGTRRSTNFSQLTECVNSQILGTMMLFFPFWMIIDYLCSP